jgi:excisionase family DNA binding protein
MTFIESEPLITISHTAALLGVSVATLRRWSKQGRLTTYRQPGTQRRLFPANEVHRLRESMRSVPEEVT